MWDRQTDEVTAVHSEQNVGITFQYKVGHCVTMCYHSKYAAQSLPGLRVRDQGAAEVGPVSVVCQPSGQFSYWRPGQRCLHEICFIS